MRPLLFALLLPTLTPGSVLTAQPTSGAGHSGFHAAVGLGNGSASLTCDGCSEDRETSLAVMLRFGGAVRPGIVLSAELNGWSKEKDGVTLTTSWLNFVAQLYPDPVRGFYVKGGAGLAGVKGTASVAGVGSAKLETTSFGLIGGVGYDLHVGRGFSLTPYADFLFAAGADAKVNGSSTGATLGANLIHIGLAASWR